MNHMKFGRAFDILQRKTQQFVKTACEPLNLTYSEYVLLMQILATEGKSQDELAEILKLDKSAITRTLSLLEQKKMIRRELVAQDKRFKRIFSTELSRAKQEYLNAIFQGWMEFLGLSEDRPNMEILSAEIERAVEKACSVNIDEHFKLTGGEN